MSIEALIQAHTAALLENTDAVKLLTLSLAGRTPSKVEDKPVVKAESKKAEVKPTVAEDVKPDIVKEDQTAAVAYADVRALVLKLAAAHRDEIKALNTKHGIAKLPDLLTDANDFATVNDQDKLEAIYADLQALGGE